MPLSLSSSTLFIAVATGASLALTSVAHCAVMCGPLATASQVRGGAHASRSYYLGRLVTYAAFGALAGSVGRLMLQTPWAKAAEAALSWLLAATLLVSAVRMFRQTRDDASTPLLSLGREPRRSRIGSLLAHVASDPLLLGAATALLPCGVLYTALAAAAAQGHALLGATAMISFAAVSGLGVLGFAELARLFARAAPLRWVASAALVLGSVLLVVRPLPLLRADGADLPACHRHAEGRAR